MACSGASSKAIGEALRSIKCGGFGHDVLIVCNHPKSARHAAPLRRRRTLFRGGFLRRRIQEPRTCPENLTVRPVFFAKENLALAGIAVIPAGEEGEMFAEFAARGGGGRRDSCLQGFSFEIVLENVLGGARLAGDFREAEKVGLGKTARANGEDADGLLLGGALENHSVEILDAAGKLGLKAQGFVEFFDALVKLSGALEIEVGAGVLAFGFDGRAERVAAG